MKRIEFISFGEFEKIFKAEKDRKMKLALMLGFGSGLRISEIIGLKKSISRCCDANIEMKRIEVIGKKLKKYFCSKCSKELTFNKDMKLSKTEWAIPPLQPEQVDLKAHQIRLDIAKGGKWRVTVTPPTLTPEYTKLLPLNIIRRTLQWRFDKLTQKVLGKKMSFHILRHGF